MVYPTSQKYPGWFFRKDGVTFLGVVYYRSCLIRIVRPSNLRPLVLYLLLVRSYIREVCISMFLVVNSILRLHYSQI